MNPVNNLLSSLEEILKSRGHIYTASVDLCHGLLLLGALTSAKPNNVLELGIGPAFASEILCAGIKYNNKGRLTCVDNLADLGGNLPQAKLDYLKENGVNIVAPIDEKDFVEQSELEGYDFLVSDAYHGRAHLWAERVFDIMKPNSFMFFHDVLDNKNLLRYKEIADEREYHNHIFSDSSRSDENCHRGWLFIIKK